MTSRTRLAALLLPALVTSIATAQQPPARPASDSAIEEVVVTAQRRAENLQEVPIAVSAFSEAELERRQVTRTLDLIAFVPNMSGHNNTGLGTANTYSIRALNNSESIATFDPPVGTYVDDVFMARQNANNFQFFDVEQIEVLRGPQGTLFGRNTTGGAINVRMKKPADEFRAFAEVGYGEYARKQARASVDLPVTGTLLTKFSAFYAEDDGYVENRTTGATLNGEETWGVRGAARVLFSDSVTWDASLEHIDASISNLVNFVQPGSSQRVNFTRMPTSGGLGPALVSPRLQDISLGNSAKSSALISNFTIEASDAVTLNFITGIRRLDQQFMTDSFDSITGAVFTANNGYELVSAMAGTATPLVNDGEHTQFTQEIKLTGEALDGRMKYVTGLFGFYDNNDTSFANISLPVTGAPTVTQDRTMKNKTQSAAVYFQADYELTDKLTATAGVRYTDETKSIDFQPNVSPIATRLFPAFSTIDLVSFGVPTELNEKLWTPRFAVDYKATDDLMFFASATRGFKSGGWNARANFGRLALDFAAEKVWSYETGMRSEWFDGRLRVNLNAFQMDVEDFQLPAGYADPVTNIINYLTRNFAGLQDRGLEAEVTWAPTDRINVVWAGGTQSAKYVDVDPSVLAQAANCQVLIATGRPTTNICNVSIVTPTGDISEPVRAPEFTSTLGINGRIPLGSTLELVPSVNWNYMGDAWAATANTPIGLQKAHSTYNGGVTLRDTDGKWSVTADCTNCTNTEYVVSFLVYPYLPEPRRWMVRARYDF
jgi:iron complex outermembrane recepter protein